MFRSRNSRRSDWARASRSPATVARRGSRGRIFFMASREEYTPPVIFSDQERAKLVFKIEARLEDEARELPIGLPVAIRALRPEGGEPGCTPAPGRDIAIDVEGLTKSFGGKKVVDNLTMQVERGRIHGFLGPNGSGKTTTIRMLCGLLTPDSGRGSCLGLDIRTQQDEIKRHGRLYDAALLALWRS